MEESQASGWGLSADHQPAGGGGFELLLAWGHPASPSLLGRVGMQGSSRPGLRKELRESGNHLEWNAACLWTLKLCCAVTFSPASVPQGAAAPELGGLSYGPPEDP